MIRLISLLWVFSFTFSDNFKAFIKVKDMSKLTYPIFILLFFGSCCNCIWLSGKDSPLQGVASKNEESKSASV
jgi:hypothetical protein